MDIFLSLFFSQCRHFLPVFAVVSGFIKFISFQQCLDVQPRPPGNKGNPASLVDVRNQPPRLGHEIRHIEIFPRFQIVHQVMNNPLPLRCRRLCRTDIKALVKEHGITGNNLGI